MQSNQPISKRSSTTVTVSSSAEDSRWKPTVINEGRKYHKLSSANSTVSAITAVVMQVIAAFSLCQGFGMQIPLSLFAAVQIVTKLQMRRDLEKTIARETNAKNYLSIAEIAEWSILSQNKENFENLEQLQNKIASLRPCFEEFQNVEQKIMALQQSLVDNQSKLEEAHSDLTWWLKHLPDSIKLESVLLHQEGKTILELQKKQLILNYRFLLSTVLHSDSSSSVIKELLLCPYTKEPLLDAITVIMETGTLTLSARFLGMQIVKGKVINIPDAKISEEAAFIINHMVSCKPDFSTVALAELASKNIEIEIGHDGLLDPIYSETFKDPKSLPCGHAINNEDIEKLNSPVCPLCREGIYDTQITDHALLKNIIKILQNVAVDDIEYPEVIAIKQKECSLEIAHYQEMLPFFSNIRIQHGAVSDHEGICAKQNKELVELPLKLHALKEELEKAQAPENFRILTNKTSELVEAFKKQDPEAIMAMEKARQEILSIQEKKIQEAEKLLAKMESEKELYEIVELLWEQIMAQNKKSPFIFTPYRAHLNW